MIDWIIGGLIAAATIVIIVRAVVKTKNGDGCHCSGCPMENANCPSKK